MSHPNIQRFTGLILICMLAASGCAALPVQGAGAVAQKPAIRAEIVFEAAVPTVTAADAKLTLEILDEITGLAFNPTRHPMALKEPGVYFINLPLPLGKTLRYRYLLDGETPAREFNPYGDQIRYRLYQVDGPSINRDTIYSWDSRPYDGPVGRIFGSVRDSTTNAPVPNAIINICGITTVTASTGSFILDRIPTGTHNLVIITPTGAFTTFQQGVTVADQASTPVDVPLTPSAWVEITFTVKLPENTPNLPLRLIGNLPGLGVLFAEGKAGMGTLASRAPIVHRLPDGTHQITLTLPAGYSLEYKYSLGDGFWNGELNTDGTPRIRELVVPAADTLVNDQVDTFLAPGTQPYHIRFTAPVNTPPTDFVSIQLNPFDWSEPIPMTTTGTANEWEMVLLNPVSYFQTARYRYCRNDQCTAQNPNALPYDTENRQLNPETSKDQKDSLSAWSNWPVGEDQMTVTASAVTPRSSDFITGVELSPNYLPAWKASMDGALNDVRSLNGGWLVFTPSWRVTSTNPPSIALNPTTNYGWEELNASIRAAETAGQTAAIFPLLDPMQPANDFWHDAELTDGWWNSFYDRLGPYLINYADQASQAGAPLLILGDPTLLPSMPGGRMPGTDTVVAPGFAEARWKALLADVRKRFTGKIFWAVSYPDSFAGLPALDVDGYYLIYQRRATSSPFTYSDLNAQVKKDLTDFFANNQTAGKPVVFRYQAPAQPNAHTGCSGEKKTCSPVTWMDFWYLRTDLKVDVKEQLESYSAVFNAVNEIPEISGFISAGYDPGLAALDNTASVRGKPASSIIWYWFSNWNGK